jgi:ABC-type Na+ efflux pump permease subunit
MVIRREYLDRVRKKSFWVGIMIFPLIMGLMFVMPILLGGLSTDKKWTIAFVDATGKLLEPFRSGLADQKMKNGSAKYVIEPVEIEGTIEATEKALEPRITSG